MLCSSVFRSGHHRVDQNRPAPAATGIPRRKCPTSLPPAIQYGQLFAPRPFSIPQKRLHSRNNSSSAPQPQQAIKPPPAAQNRCTAPPRPPNAISGGRGGPHTPGIAHQTMLRPSPERHPHPPRCLPGCSGPASHRETNTLGPHFASRGPSFQHAMLHAVTLAQPPRLCAGAALVAVSQTFVLRHRSSRTGRTGQATQGRCCTDAHGWHQRPALTP